MKLVDSIADSSSNELDRLGYQKLCQIYLC
jgi:hypothetical protein